MFHVKQGVDMKLDGTYIVRCLIAGSPRTFRISNGEIENSNELERGGGRLVISDENGKILLYTSSHNIDSIIRESVTLIPPTQ